MRRILPLAILACACATQIFTGVASAQINELGATHSPIIAPSCPKTIKPQDCTIILTEVTAIETIRDDIAYPSTVTSPGYIEAFSVGLAQLSSNRQTALQYIRGLDKTYGGTTQAAITVLTPTGKKGQFLWKVKAESPMFHLQPYLGTVVQFPLQTALPVAKGDVIALTVPTWAPVLSIQQPTKTFAYRQSRTANCANPPAQSQAQQTVGTTTKYGCDYPGTRLEYSATEVTTPVPPKNYVH